MKRQIRSCFGRSLLNLKGIWLWSAALALLCTLISWPGIWYSDSYVRVDTASAILDAIAKTLTGHRYHLETGNWFTVIPSFFIAVSLGLTDRAVLYIFGQAFAFFAATFLLIRELNPTGRKLLYVLFACFPLIYGMSVYLEAGIGCVTGMAALILLFRRTGVTQTRGDRILEFLLVAFSSFVMVGYRTNAVSVIPVLLYYLLRMRTRKSRKALAVLALALGIAFTRGVPLIFDVHSQSVSSSGFIWEMLTVIGRMEPAAQEKYAGYLDGLGGEGSTLAALEESNDTTAESFMYGGNLGIDQMSAPGATKTVVLKYLQLILEKPAEWFSVKMEMASRTLGLSQPLGTAEYDYDRWGRMKDYGMQDTPYRRAFYDSCVFVTSALGFLTARPWVLFLLSAALLLLNRRRKGADQKTALILFWSAAWYYLVYVLDPIYFQFRYFYPSFYLLIILDASVLRSLAGSLIRKLRKS